MIDARSSDRAVIEVRTYRARAGQRERLVALLRELAFPVHRKLGMRVSWSVPFAEDPATFVWLRAFPDGASRDELKRAFYEGPEWSSELERLLMPRLEDYAAVLVEDHDELWEHWPDE